MAEPAGARIEEATTAIGPIQWITVAWMTVEAAVALLAAVRARSVALAAFGVDSGIELLSAGTVLWRFRSGQRGEAAATKITSWLLVALAVYIAADSAYMLLTAAQKAQESYLGIALLAAAAVVMPWLGRRKRQLAAIANSTSLRADARQSSICGYMAWIALAGLLLNAFAHIWWADPLAALCLLPIVIKEAREAFEGHSCC
jgi:divalent metal cation (Fe/Co/Zn/Cd) transporter